MIAQKKAISFAWSLALAALMVTPTTPAWSQIFKVTDSEEGVVFTDKPSVVGNGNNQNVERVELNSTNTVAPVETRPKPEPVAEPEVIEEPTVRIESPADESTNAMAGIVTISASTSPVLTRGEGLQLLMDGTPQGEPKTSGNWTLEGVLRGPHDFVVRRVTSRGKMIAESDPIKVYVLRPSIIAR